MSEESMVELERRIKTAEDLAALKMEVVHIHSLINIHNTNVNATLNAQNTQMAVQSKIIAELSESLKSVNDTLSQAQGGWKTFMWIGGLGASLGAIGVSIWQGLRGGG